MNVNYESNFHLDSVNLII